MRECEINFEHELLAAGSRLRARRASPADDLPIVDALEVRGIVRVAAHVLGELRVPAEEQARQRYRSRA